uniref:Uncharacterized protein n=1 Tax=Cacopsylla melanoneura TaxID=428564 RepID=A0A8D8LNB9_9HEMI
MKEYFEAFFPLPSVLSYSILCTYYTGRYISCNIDAECMKYTRALLIVVQNLLSLGFELQNSSSFASCYPLSKCMETIRPVLRDTSFAFRYPLFNSIRTI